MRGALLERDAELAALEDALAAAERGEGSVALVSGEAGIGKTSLVRAFLRAVDGRARVLSGACDDLVTPRTLGPLRDVAHAIGPASALARALTAGDRDGVLGALLAELSGSREATVLVVEDVHWADDATLDVVRFVGRRVGDTRGLLVVTYRADELGSSLRRVLGALGGERVHRTELSPLSPAAVAHWAGGTTVTTAHLYRLTGGNPFFLSEALADGADGGRDRGDAVPATVVDAVVARLHRLDPGTRAALEQLAVVPTEVDLALARALLDDLTPLAAAERAGLVEFRARAVAFRHELARRAVEDSLPATTRMRCHARVLAVERDRPGADPARLVHHAIGAGDDAAVVAVGPAAAAAAGRAGAHAQEVAVLDTVLARSALLTVHQRATSLQTQATALFATGRLTRARQVVTEAARLWEDLDEPEALGETLVAAATIHWAVARPGEALAMSARAVELLSATGDDPRHAWALIGRALLLTALDRYPDALPVVETARDIARRLGAAPLVTQAEIVRGRVRLELGDEEGHGELRRGIAGAAAGGDHLFVMMGYVCLVQELWRLGRLAETERCIRDGLAYAQERELDFYLDYLHGHRHRLAFLRGEWRPAEQGLRAMVTEGDEQAGAVRHGLPVLARLLVRRGAEDVEAVLARAGEYARAADGRYELVPALLAEIEHAWLTSDSRRAREAVGLLGERTSVPGAERQHAELLRWRRRLGEDVAPFPGCPEPFAAGLRGDWRAAAAAWDQIGAPYEQALELADSGDRSATLEALGVLDGLGACPAAALVRRRLRDLGVHQVPRGPTSTTRANPAGLTGRQAEILRLLVDGRTNAEIAARLVLSVRTVDHHVSAVLAKLGVDSRKSAAAAAAELGLL